MADRVSTIRFKVEGTPEVTSKIEELNRQIIRQQRALAQSAKEAAQAQIGGTGGAGAAVAQAQKDAEQLGRLHAMREKEFADQQARELSNAQRGLAALNAAEVDQAFKSIQIAAQAAKRRNDIRVQEVKEWERAEAEKVRISEKWAAVERRLAAQQAESLGGALSGFGGKMIIAHAAGMAAGDVIGDQHGGREIGAVIGGFMFGGPAIGVATAGIELLGTALKAVREGTEAARKAAQEYTDVLERLGQTGADLVERTPFGSKMQKELDQSTANMRKLATEGRTLLGQGPSFGEIVANRLFGRSFDRLPWLTALNATAEQIRLEKLARDESRQSRDREDAARSGDQQKKLDAEGRILGVQSMRSGFLKQEAELNAQINLRHVERMDTDRSRKQEADEEVNRQQLLLKAAEDRLKNAPKTLDAQARKTLAADVISESEKLASVQKANRDVNTQQYTQHQFDILQDQQDRAKLAAEHDARIEEQTSKTQQAQIRAENDGYKQRLLLQEEAYAERERKAADDGQEMVELVKREHEQIIVIEQKAAKEQMEAARAAFDPNSALARYRREAEERGVIGRAAGATPQQIAAWDKEQLVGNYLRENDELRVELALRKKQITQEEAEIQLGVLRNQLAQGNGPEAAAVRAQIAANARLREEVREAEERQRAVEQIQEKYFRLAEKPLHAGFFSTQFTGPIDFAALRGNFSDPGGLNAAARQMQMVDEILHLLERLETRGGLN